MIKNILNWTCGGFFRALGRILCFLVIGLIIGYFLSVNDFKLPDILGLGIMKVNADTLNYDYSSFAVREGTTWTSQGPFGTGVHNLTVNAVSIRLGYTDVFKANQTYRIIYDVGYADITVALEDILVLNPSSYTCAGSTQWSSWSNNEAYIQSCNLIGVTRVNNTNKVRYVFEITPLQNIRGIQTLIRFDNDRYTLSTINVYNTTNITFPEDVGGAINEQTTIIQNEFNDLSQTIIENNQNLINSITEQNQVCDDIIINKNSVYNTLGALASNCGFTSSSSALITDYISLNDYSIVSGLRSGASYCFYDITKTPIGTKTGTSASSITIPSGAKYIRFQFSSNNYEFATVHSCKSGNQALNDILTDTDSDSESNSIYDELSNFNLSIEGPLTTIIRIPIDLLNTLLVDYNSSQTHADLCTTFVGKQICLPSGDILWKRTGCHDNAPFGCPDYNAFRNFFQLVAGGAITYTLLRRLVKTIEKGLDPSSSRVDLMRL